MLTRIVYTYWTRQYCKCFICVMAFILLNKTLNIDVTVTLRLSEVKWLGQHHTLTLANGRYVILKQTVTHYVVVHIIVCTCVLLFLTHNGHQIKYHHLKWIAWLNFTKTYIYETTTCVKIWNICRTSAALLLPLHKQYFLRRKALHCLLRARHRTFTCS